MQDNLSSSAQAGTVLGALASKFLPAAIGAGIMIAVDPPKTKRDLFARAFCAFAMSYLFGDVLFDFLQSLDRFAFLDPVKQGHKTAVDGIVGATGWFVAGGAVVMLKKFRSKPVELIERVTYIGKEKP